MNEFSRLNIENQELQIAVETFEILISRLQTQVSNQNEEISKIGFLLRRSWRQPNQLMPQSLLVKDLETACRKMSIPLGQ